MSLLGLAFYVILCWFCFFLMLPIGVQNLDEAGEARVAGEERGAPARPNLWKKALWAALLAAAIWVLGFVLLVSGVVRLRPD